MNNNCNILVVEDEQDIQEILQFNLESEGFSVELASSAEEALDKLRSYHNLILLDVMMEGISGYKMAEKLRKSGNNIPIIFLTAKNSENDMLTGFSLGGDDYISKPFSIKEVIARVKSILKRIELKSNKHKITNKLIEIEKLFINLDTKKVTIEDNVVDLTKTEFEILILLLSNENKLFSREDILEKVWKNGFVVERTVDVHIARLRKKIGEYGNLIINKTGYGYGFFI